MMLCNHHLFLVSEHLHPQKIFHTCEQSPAAPLFPQLLPLALILVPDSHISSLGLLALAPRAIPPQATLRGLHLSPYLLLPGSCFSTLDMLSYVDHTL